MGLESVTLIKDLNAANPAPGDNKAEGDDHLRNIKKALKNTFPNIDKPVTRTADQLNVDPLPKVTDYQQLLAPSGTGYAMQEWHLPTKIAYINYIEPGDNRFYWSQSNGNRGSVKGLMSIGSEGRLDVYGSISTGGNVHAGSYSMNGGGSSTMQFQQNGWGTRFIHRANELIGFLSEQFTWNFWVRQNGDAWVQGNMTWFSDERYKKDWTPIPEDLIENLAALEKVGTYTTKDEFEQRRLGGSAQELQRFLPDATPEDHDGRLGIVYGNVSYVAVVALCRRLLALEEEVRQLREAK
ncbi:MAG: tail fiber domain-containing protein [Bdellovibrio sp.]